MSKEYPTFHVTTQNWKRYEWAKHYPQWFVDMFNLGEWYYESREPTEEDKENFKDLYDNEWGVKEYFHGDPNPEVTAWEGWFAAMNWEKEDETDTG